MSGIRNTACVVLLVVATTGALAKQNRPDQNSQTEQPANPRAEQRKPLEPTVRKILSVFDQMLESQKTFPDNNLRIGTQIQVADMLWTYDEPRARRILEEAFGTLAAANLVERSRPSSQLSTAFFNVALYSIRTAVKRDPALVSKLTESLLDPQPTPNPQTGYTNLSDLRVWIVSYLWAEAPQQAARAVRALAQTGELNKLLPMLRTMRTKDPKAADDLFLQMFEKAKFGEPSIDDIRGLAWYLFPHFGDGLILFPPSSAERDPYATIPLSPAVIEQFLELAYNAVPARLEQSAANTGGRLIGRLPFDYGVAKLLGLYFDHFLPARAAAYRARVEETRLRLPVEVQQRIALNEPGTVSELLGRAETVTDLEQRDTIYQKAADQASAAGNVDQAAAIVEKIRNESSRSSQRARLNDSRGDEIWKALGKGDFEEADKMIALLSYPAQRLFMFRNLIGHLVGKDRPRALALLEREHKIAANIANPVERAQELIMLSGAYGLVDANQGFEEMSVAIEEFNRAGFSPEWDKVQERETTAEGGRPNSLPLLNSGVSSLLSNFDFQTLGRTDFDRALVLARQLQPREASAFAQLAVCRGALARLLPAPPPKPPPPAKKEDVVKTQPKGNQ